VGSDVSIIFVKLGDNMGRLKGKYGGAMIGNSERQEIHSTCSSVWRLIGM
jgi:hypothetical protein